METTLYHELSITRFESATGKQICEAFEWIQKFHSRCSTRLQNYLLLRICTESYPFLLLSSSRNCPSFHRTSRSVSSTIVKSTRSFFLRFPQPSKKCRPLKLSGRTANYRWKEEELHQWRGGLKCRNWHRRQRWVHWISNVFVDAIGDVEKGVFYIFWGYWGGWQKICVWSILKYH